MTKVYIENPDVNYTSMFERRGFTVTNNFDEADLIQFTGGADIDPSFYGKDKHPLTQTSVMRDLICGELYYEATNQHKPMAGICRGSQFLHAMAGGRLVQHCDNHAIQGTHEARCSWMPGTIPVSSTHHQMMYSEEVGEVLMWAENRATLKETTNIKGGVYDMELNGQDIEAMYYPSINAISFQPHPEYNNGNNNLQKCEDAYFFILKNYLGVV